MIANLEAGSTQMATLRQWMDREKKDIIEVAKLCGVSVHTVKKWLRPLGDKEGRTPRPAKQLKISEITKGVVSPNDWVGL